MTPASPIGLSFAARAERLRRNVVSHATWGGAASLTGPSAAGIGLYLAVDSHWAAAAACLVASVALLWLSGVGVLRTSRDAYLRKLGNTWVTWATEAQSYYDAFSRRRKKLHARIGRLSPPPELKDDHQRLVALLADAEGVGADRLLPAAERTARSVAAFAAAAEVRSRLTRARSTEAQRRYAAGLEALLAKRDAEYATATDKVERADEGVARRLSRMRPPAMAQDQHAELARAFTAYVDCVRELHAATRSRQVDRAEEAAQRLELVHERLQTANAAVSDRLDHAGRRPVPAPSSDND